MMKRILLLLLLMFSLDSFSQKSYEYVIVNSKFDFVSNIDGYSTSSYTKFLFDKKQYKAFLDNQELPLALASNKCEAIFVDVKDESGLFTTKVFIELKDCRGKILKRSEIGDSRLKDRKRAYFISIKKAFNTLGDLKFPRPVRIVEAKQEKKIVKAKKDFTEKVLEVNAFKVGEEHLLFDLDKNLLFKMIPTKSKDRFQLTQPKGTVVRSGDFWIVKYVEKGKQVSKKLKINF